MEFDPSDLLKNHIVVNGMTFTKSQSNHLPGDQARDDGYSYLMYTGQEYKSGKGIIKEYIGNVSNIGHFRMETSDNEYTDFELNKCNNSFIFKQMIYGQGR